MKAFNSCRSYRATIVLLSGICTSASSSAWAAYADVGSMLQALAPTVATTAPQLVTLVNAVDNLPTYQEKNNALLTLTPLVDGSLRAGTEGNSLQITQLISQRRQGVAKGAAWIAINGDNILQTERSNLPGYQAEVAGLVIGRDYLRSESSLLGAALAYTHADVRSRGPSGSFRDSKTYQGLAYAGYQAKHFYWQSALTLGRNDYKNNRKILVLPTQTTAAIVNIAQAKFFAWEADVAMETGYGYLLGQQQLLLLTPKLLLGYHYMGSSTYTESDAYALNMQVKYRAMHFLPLGVGLSLSYENSFPQVKVIPELHLYAYHDLMREAEVATATLSGGGYPFLSQGAKPAANSLDAGFSLRVLSAQHTSVNIHYDFMFRNNYHRHQGLLKIKYEWA